MSGVSSAAMSSLAKYDATMIEPIKLHSRSRPKRRKIEFTMIVSTSWLIHVEPLLRSHRCLPPVTRHQKW